MILITATLEFESESDRDKAVSLSKPIQKATRDEEEGCNAYVFAADPCSPTTIQVFEEWVCKKAVAAHFTHSNYEAMVAVLNSTGLIDASNKVYLVAKTEPAYGPNGETRDAFFEGIEEPEVS